MNGKNIYDIYSLSVDKRDILTIGSDAWIITQIKSRLAKENFTSSLDVGVESFYGYVYLVGEFENEKELKRALRYAKSVNGVRKVTVYGAYMKTRKSCTFADDISITAKVKSALISDSDIVGSNIHVHSVQCKVVMLGVVKNDYIKDRAIKIGEKMGFKVISFMRALN